MNNCYWGWQNRTAIVYLLLYFLLLLLFSVSLLTPDEDYVSKVFVFLTVLYVLSYRWVHLSRAVLSVVLQLEKGVYPEKSHFVIINTTELFLWTGSITALPNRPTQTHLHQLHPQNHSRAEQWWSCRCSAGLQPFPVTGLRCSETWRRPARCPSSCWRSSGSLLHCR